MTEELKQAISALQCAKRGHCDHAMADEAIAALERTLTQRPAAQAGEHPPHRLCGCDACRPSFEDDAPSSLPTHPAAQAGEREAKCQTCNGHGLVGGHMQDGSGYGEGCPDCNPEPAPLVKWAGTQPAARTEREAFEAEMRCEETWGHRSLKKRPDGRYQNWQVDVMWDVWQARASLPTQPAQQATPEPSEQWETSPLDGETWETYPMDGEQWETTPKQATPEPVEEPVKWWNGCDKSVPDALRYLANNPRPTGGSDRYNAEHLFQLAGEIERMARQPLFTRPAPGVPEGWHMDREGDDVIVVRHQAVGLARATNPATSMHGQILFALCDDILQDRKSLAAAQAKGGDHA